MGRENARTLGCEVKCMLLKHNNGRVYTVDSFCKEFGITKSMFHNRKRKGWNLDEIASIPKNAIGGYRPKGVRVYHG